MYYVTMTDKFFSNWGCAQGRISKFVVICENKKQAEQIKSNAEKRPEMKFVNICANMPHYSSSKYQVGIAHYNELSGTWKR